MLERIAQAIERHHMFDAGMRVGVAVSGGVDSLFLLHALHELSPRWNLRLSVVHIEHGIRGEASRQDAEFVRTSAQQFGLPFYLREASAAQIDDNLEQAARGVRHDFYRELMAQGVLDRVATGHTLSDQAETVLYRLLRGSGLAGLSGILPMTKEGLVRPVLEISRPEIGVWMQQRSIEWRHDETNQDRTFARNRLRHDVLPLLRQNFNPRLDDALAHLAVLARDEEDYWNRQLLPLATEKNGPPGEVRTIRTSELTSRHPALARRLIRQMLESVKGDLRQIDFSHIETVLTLARTTEGSGRVQLPALDIFRSFDWIRVAPAGYDSGRERDFDLVVQAPGQVALPGGRVLVTFQLIDRENVGQSHDKLDNELDWQRLALTSEPDAAGQGGAGLLELRNWRPGDHYRPANQPQEQKIKLLFQEARIPLWERRNWPVLTCGGRIAWTRQFGPAAEFACRAETRKILRVCERNNQEA